MVIRRSVGAYPTFRESAVCLGITEEIADMLLTAIRHLRTNGHCYPPLMDAGTRVLYIPSLDDTTPDLRLFYRIDEDTNQVILIAVQRADGR